MYRLQDKIRGQRTQAPGKSYANEPKPAGTCKKRDTIPLMQFREASDLSRFGETPLQLEWRFAFGRNASGAEAHVQFAAMAA